jgi:hypothetical protein
MKKIMLFALMVIFPLCAFSITPDSNPKSENPAVPVKREYKMSDEEINNLAKRAEVIPGLDKSQQTYIVREKKQKGHGNKRDREAPNRDNQRHRRAVFIGGGAALLLFFMIIIIV